mmetsp:Transcript_23737/g.56070  ORF Transcript_23737/g.56070 Transcript_23737/m.56070 type:complete len:86 (-) Transcript_23737:2014-2271(-)
MMYNLLVHRPDLSRSIAHSLSQACKEKKHLFGSRWRRAAATNVLLFPWGISKTPKRGDVSDNADSNSSNYLMAFFGHFEGHKGVR